MLLVKKLVTLLLVCVLLLCAFTVTASAAYVTDGEQLYIAGDANSDGQIDVCDLVKAKVGGENPAADLDGDGTVGSYDLALIRAMILGIDNSEWTE